MEGISMLEINIPGFGRMKLENLVCDFTGTLSADGKLLPGAKECIVKAAAMLSVHVVTNDTFGTALDELKGLKCKVVVLEGGDADMQKENYVKRLGADTVAAIGNGNNDRMMLKVARLGIAVVGQEGCSAQAIMAADIVVKNVIDGFGLFFNTGRCIASLRF